MRVSSDRLLSRIFTVWFLTALILVFMVPDLSLAVDGLSSGKLIMPWARTLEPGVAEFEPTVSFTGFDEELDSNGDKVPLDGDFQITTIDFRATAGLAKRFEMGAAFGIETTNFHHESDPTLDESETSLRDLALGWKYRLWGDNENMALAAQWGVGLPWVSHDSFAVWEAGLVYTLPIGDKWSVDVDGTFYLTSETSEGDPEIGSLYDLGLGVDITDKFTVAAELNGYWERTRGNDMESWKVTPTLGFAYGVNDILSVCMLGQQDIEGMGKNTELASAVQILFTFGIE